MTILGFVMDKTKLYIFNYGDGIYIVNDVVEQIDYDNVPPYIGYVPFGIVDAPDQFTVREYPLEDVDKFAICSDGFEVNHVEKLWEHDNPLGLTRELRKLRLQNKAVFSDDCTVIAVDNIREEE